MKTASEPPPPAAPSGSPAESGYGKAGDRVTTAVRELIANGGLQPGEHLRQDTLAARLGTTRVPVREAFKTLVAEGLLVHRPNQGHYVAKLTSDELAEICWLRDTCENRLAQTVEWPDAEYLDTLAAINDAMRRVRGSAYEIVAADRRFHERLWALSPLRIVAQEAARTWALIQPYRSFMSYEPATVERMHREHAAITAALREQDLDAYADAVRVHQEHVYRVVEDLAERERAQAH